jgi:hypothetical protein
MEPSSTAFRRAGGLLTIIALISLARSEPAAARGFIGMGRVQALRVVPRIPVPPRIVHRDFGNRHIAMPNNRLIQNRFHGHRFGYLSLPYAPYLVDTGQPSGPGYAADDIGPSAVPFEPPACVRPLIIHIKPARHATGYPRVIYGRPLGC